MNQQRYAYAVAYIRGRQTQLLSEEEQERLWQMEEEGVRRLLREKGWETQLPPLQMAEQQRIDAWDTLLRIAPDKNALLFLRMPEEYANLTICLLRLSGQRTRGAWARPYVTSPERIWQAMEQKRVCDLPPHLQKAAEEALQHPMPGPGMARSLKQAMLKETMENAQDETLQAIAKELVQAENDKTLYRGAVFEQTEEEIQRQLWLMDDEWPALQAALKGRQTLCAYWQKMGHLADCPESPSEFEAWRESISVQRAAQKGQSPFGPGALAAYDLAVKAETRTVCLRLLGGLSARERRRRWNG